MKGETNIEVIGIDHIYVAVSQIERSEKYYDRVMPLLGFEKNTFQNDGDRHIQYYNRHFGFVLRPAHAKSAHDPLAPGLHHFCFRVEDDATVDRVAKEFAALGIPILVAPALSGTRARLLRHLFQ